MFQQLSIQIMAVWFIYLHLFDRSAHSRNFNLQSTCVLREASSYHTHNGTTRLLSRRTQQNCMDCPWQISEFELDWSWCVWAGLVSLGRFLFRSYCSLRNLQTAVSIAIQVARVSQLDHLFYILYLLVKIINNARILIFTIFASLRCLRDYSGFQTFPAFKQ